MKQMKLNFVTRLCEFILAFMCWTVTIDALEKECSLEKVNMDAVFVIDGSLSIDPSDFKKGECQLHQVMPG